MQNVSSSDEIPAGEFSGWLDDIQAVLRDGGDAVVPCGGCTACCTSSQFVQISPDETDTLAHIPDELLFPAPGLPEGNMVLGYDERGHCPMLKDGLCSIYEHRPRTCRTYDCRVFAATTIKVGLPKIDERVKQWRFEVTTPDARRRLNAVRSAAANQENETSGIKWPSKLALKAIETHEEFLE